MNLADRNLVLKGGVTSGLIYAGSLPALSRAFRFRAIAGSSAGAIAAAFAAAAEFARAQGDEDGFARLQARGAELPDRLLELFQAGPPFARLLRALVHLAPGTGRGRWLAALLCFWPELLAGALTGALLASGGGSYLQVIFDMLLGALVALGLHLAWLLFTALPRRNFGLCSGLGQAGRPALTDWLHEALQTIAFGAAGRTKPLTFGDLAAVGVDLRILATNLSHARPETTPELAAGLRFRPAAWARLFPAPVLAAMGEAAGDAQPLPVAADLPVLVAVRMSLACPGLMETVPALDAAGRTIWYADGGLTTNFPFELFEDEARPTLALDFDTLHPDEAETPRVRALEAGAWGDRPADLSGLRAFAWSLLVALREGRLRSAARDLRRRVRVYQVRLTADEGGMNLAMTGAAAQRLIGYGEALAAFVLATEGEGAA